MYCRRSTVRSTHLGRDGKFPLGMLTVDRLLRFIVYAQTCIPKLYSHVTAWNIGACGGASYHGQLALLATHARTHTLRCNFSVVLYCRGGALGLVLFTGCRKNYAMDSKLPNELLFHTVQVHVLHVQVL